MALGGAHPCANELNASLKVSLQEATQESGVCIRCCQAAPTVEGLLCQVCFVKIRLEDAMRLSN